MCLEHWPQHALSQGQLKRIRHSSKVTSTFNPGKRPDHLRLRPQSQDTSKIAGRRHVNGDEIDDLIVGASPPGSMPGMPNTSSGAAFVIFGSETLTAVDPGQLGENGFRIDPGPLTSDFGRSVAAAGDVNGDGLDDVSSASPTRRPTSPGISLPGAAYIVFGKRSTTPVNVAALATVALRSRETPAPSLGRAI